MYILDHNNKSFWNMFIYTIIRLDMFNWNMKFVDLQCRHQANAHWKEKLKLIKHHCGMILHIEYLYYICLTSVRISIFFPTLFAYCYILSLNRFVYSVTSCSLNKIIWLTNVHQNQAQLYICSFFLIICML